VSLATNAQYQALAATAAAALGNPSPSIVKAILAQWQCEIGNVPYPPPRNNPGNNAAGWVKALGIPYTVQTPNPQPGNPIVTFGSPADGARSYAGGIRTFARYSVARAAIARGDGVAFLVAICAAGYGTSPTCALGVYRGETGTVSTSPIVLTSAPAPATTTLAAYLKIDPTTPVTTALLRQAADQLNAGKGLYSGNPAGYVEMVQYLNAHPGILAGSFPVTATDQGTTAPTGAALFGLFGWVPSVVVNAALLILILALAYSGFHDLVDG
jgi:hypothetical protein